MKSIVFALAFALLLAQPAAAQMRTITEAHEVALSELRLPGTESGTIGFKPCEQCEYRTERVSPETVYLVNGRRVSLDDFTKTLAGVNSRESTYVTVFHHLDRNIVTRVRVTVR